MARRAPPGNERPCRGRKRWLLAGALLLAGLGGGERAAWATDTTSEPYPGVTWLFRNTSTQKIHVLTIDLTQRVFRIRATEPPGGMPTDDFAVAYGCQLAINGDFGTVSAPWKTTGLAMGNGIRWENTNDGTLEGYTAFGRDNRVVQSPPAEVLQQPEPWMHEIVGGRPLVVDQGVALDPVPPYSRDGCSPHFCELHPRTAAGINQDGTALILATIDGRYTGAAGMTTKQVGTLMVEMGAWRALNMDGGGSTTMYIENQGGVVNSPSDGSVRTVSNHLGIQIVEPVGDLTGYVRDTDVDDESAGLADAEVSLTTGETTWTDATGRYEFSQVPAGDTTLTASSPGFGQGRLDVDVIAADTTEANIALFPAAPDADGGDGPDAAEDAGAATVGGIPADSDGSGCVCTLTGAASRRPGTWLAVGLAVTLSLARRRTPRRSRRIVRPDTGNPALE